MNLQLLLDGKGVSEPLRQAVLIMQSQIAELSEQNENLTKIIAEKNERIDELESVLHRIRIAQGVKAVAMSKAITIGLKNLGDEHVDTTENKPEHGREHLDNLVRDAVDHAQDNEEVGALRKRLEDQIVKLSAALKLARELLPKRIPNGFVSFGKYYAEQEDLFADPYNKMSKFKRQYLSQCEEALAAIDALGE